MANGCGCNDSYNGNCNCSDPVELLTAIATGPTGATGATGAAGVDGASIWYNNIGVPIGSLVSGAYQDLDTYTIDNTPTIKLGNGDVLRIKALFRVKGVITNRMVGIYLGTTLLAECSLLPYAFGLGLYGIIELYVELHKESNIIQWWTFSGVRGGSPPTLVYNGAFEPYIVRQSMEDFSNDLDIRTVCRCYGPGVMGNDVYSDYLLIEQVKHI